METEESLRRVLKLLQGSIRAAGLTQTEVDDRIGRRRGYLSHVFQRRVDLKLVDLLRVLEVLELEPGKFFGAAVGGRAGTRAGLQDFVRVMVEAGGARREPGAEEGARGPAGGGRKKDRRLMEQVRAMVRRILAEGAAGGDEEAILGRLAAGRGG